MLSACGGVSEQTLAQIQFLQELQAGTRQIIESAMNSDLGVEAADQRFFQELDHLWFGNTPSISSLDWEQVFEDRDLDPGRWAPRGGQLWMLNWMIEEAGDWTFEPAPKSYWPYQVVAKLEHRSHTLEMALYLQAVDSRWQVEGMCQIPPVSIRRRASAEAFVQDYCLAIQRACETQPAHEVDMDNPLIVPISQEIQRVTAELIHPIPGLDAAARQRQLWELAPHLYWAVQNCRFAGDQPNYNLKSVPATEAEDPAVSRYLLTVSDQETGDWITERVDLRLSRLEGQWGFAAIPVALGE